MRKVGLSLLALVVVLLAGPALAENERFTIRFGLVGLEPTSDSEFSGIKAELNSAFGGGFDFEWYFADRFGLEGSVATVVDADVDEDNDTVAGVHVTPLTAGLNWHIVRSKRFDWSIGVVAGVIVYGDFEFEDNSNQSQGSVTTKDETTFGAQTSLDINVAKGGRWGVNIGLKYLSADLEVASNPVRDLSVDPLLFRAMGVYRW